MVQDLRTTLTVVGDQVSAQPDIHEEAGAVNGPFSSKQCPLNSWANSPSSIAHHACPDPTWPPNPSAGPQRKQNPPPFPATRLQSGLV